ncbi:MAG: VacJ family lipoprotein [Rhodospirillales bacterium]
MTPLRTAVGIGRWRRAAAAAVLAFAVAGCASTAPGPAAPPPPVAAAEAGDDAVRLIDVHDPLEGFNRGVYKFNAAFDRLVFLPVLEGYQWVVPDYLQDRIGDFFANLRDVVTFANQVLQLRIGPAGETLFRVGVNSLMGMFGLFDLATELGMPRYREDFGQTLGVWGLGEGPYLVLPILGPSNVRDAGGWAIDTVAFSLADPFKASSFQWEYPPVFALNVVEQRRSQPFRYFETGTPFEYELVRFLYTRKRQVDIRN